MHALPDIIGQTMGDLVTQGLHAHVEAQTQKHIARQLGKTDEFKGADPTIVRRAAGLIQDLDYRDILDDPTRLGNLRTIEERLSAPDAILAGADERATNIHDFLTGVAGLEPKVADKIADQYRTAISRRIAANTAPQSPAPVAGPTNAANATAATGALDQQDIVVTSSRSSGYAFGSWVDPVLQGTGDVIVGTIQWMAKNPKLAGFAKATLIAAQIAAGPELFVVQQLLAASPIGQFAESKAKEAFGWVRDKFAAKDYTPAESVAGAAGAFGLLALGVLGVSKALPKLTSMFTKKALAAEESTVVAGQAARAAMELDSIPVPRGPKPGSFNWHVQQLSETGQANVRSLQGWAKSKGWVRQPGDGPEVWGQMSGDGAFSWRLKIKPEASTRSGLQAGSQQPRFDARLDAKGTYVNPFTGQTGGKAIGTHLPLEFGWF